MSQDGNHEEGEVKRTSKLTAMIESENDGFNGLQISVYYSENNWETCEEVNLILLKIIIFFIKKKENI